MAFLGDLLKTTATSASNDFIKKRLKDITQSPGTQDIGSLAEGSATATGIPDAISPSSSIGGTIDPNAGGGENLVGTPEPSATTLVTPEGPPSRFDLFAGSLKKSFEPETFLAGTINKLATPGHRQNTSLVQTNPSSSQAFNSLFGATGPSNIPTLQHKSGFLGSLFKDAIKNAITAAGKKKKGK